MPFDAARVSPELSVSSPIETSSVANIFSEVDDANEW
jgi:hypothetical protein